MSKTIIVIGGGPAGIEAARTAVHAGANVTLVSDAPIGGRAGWHSLLPSKVWLTAADTLGQIREAGSIGIQSGNVAPIPTGTIARIHKLADAWNGAQQAELEAAGVSIVSGTAVFNSPHQITVTDEDGRSQTLDGDAIVVATGSVPIFPPGLKPDGRRVIAPRFAKHLKTLPQTMLVIGGGATGSEFAYLFNRLGVQVTWIVDELGVLPDFHPEAGEALATALTQQEVQLVAGQRATRLERTDDDVTAVLVDGNQYTAEMAFVGIGRKPDRDRLNLDAVGPADSRPDAYGRLGETAVYLVGDVAGEPMTANLAMAQARAAALHILQPEQATPVNRQAVIAAVYTDPQVAQVGIVMDSEEIGTVRLPFTAVLKGNLLPHTDGFVRLAYHTKTLVVTGAVAVGPHAVDVLAPAAVAIRQSAAIDDLAAIYPGHPTLSELIFSAARLAQVQ